MQHENLDVRTAWAGVYAVRSSSPTVYLLRAGAVPAMMRVHGGEGSPHLDGDDEWHPLVDLVCGPILDGRPFTRDDFKAWTIRVGSRSRYVIDPAHVLEYRWVVGRTVTSIEGPLPAAEIERLVNGSARDGR